MDASKHPELSLIQRSVVEKVPLHFRPGVEAALTGTAPSASCHIRAYCLLCKQGDHVAVAHCEEDTCPLRPRRPFRNSTKHL